MITEEAYVRDSLAFGRKGHFGFQFLAYSSRQENVHGYRFGGLAIKIDLDGRSLSEGLELGAEVNAVARASDECRAGVRRFLERSGP